MDVRAAVRPAFRSLTAPDYPGLDRATGRPPKQFVYTFDHIAAVMNDFTQVMGLSHYTLGC